VNALNYIAENGPGICAWIQDIAEAEMMAQSETLHSGRRTGRIFLSASHGPDPHSPTTSTTCQIHQLSSLLFVQTMLA
jgi:hypothetical protein